MSRKKVKKETVKRKTNIYDPMGVYGRGLTENQRLGMTRQMKVENIRNPGKVLTRKDLEEYSKILEFYGMYTTVRAGNIENFSISQNFSQSVTFTNQTILNWLHNSKHIDPIFFVCDSFVISRPGDEGWADDMFYDIIVGTSAFKVESSSSPISIPVGDSSVTVPNYSINGTNINYFHLYYDSDLSDMFINRSSYDLSADPLAYEDFTDLPNDGSPLPYLLYKNNALPELKLRVGFLNPPSAWYQVIFNVTVIY